MENLEKIMKRVEDYIPDPRGAPFAVIAEGVAEPVTRMLLQGWSLNSIHERLERVHGVQISAKAVGRFRKRFIDPLRSIPADTKDKMRALGERIAVMDLLAQLVESELKAVHLAEAKEKAAGKPLEIGIKARNSLRKSLEVYHKTEEKALALDRFMVLQMEQIDTRSLDSPDFDPRELSDEELQGYLDRVPMVEAVREGKGYIGPDGFVPYDE